MSHPRIVVDPKIMFGKPVIQGTRITVELILRKIAEGMTDEEILAHHPQLAVADIRAVAGFAADHLANEDALCLKRRAELVEKFVSGEWGVELASLEATEVRDR